MKNKPTPPGGVRFLKYIVTVFFSVMRSSACIDVVPDVFPLSLNLNGGALIS
jgi:hypothetical protein